MKIRISLFAVCFAVLLWFSGCEQRIRINPFDPQGNRLTPVELSVIPGQSAVKLSWRVQQIVGFTGFRVYRSADTDRNFQLLAELSSKHREYVDSTVVSSRWYFYRVTVLGKSVESKPSNVEKVLLGPGEVWILTRYGYSIQRYSYDLQSRLAIYNTDFPPIDWDWDLEQNNIWLAAAQFGYVSRLNLNSGGEDFFIRDSLRYPIDVQWVPHSNALFILDIEQQRIFRLVNETLSTAIRLPSDEYRQFALDQQGHLWVLGKKDALWFNLFGALQAQIVFGNGFTGKDLIYRDGFFFILAANDSVAVSRLFKVTAETGAIEQFDIPGSLTKIRKTGADDYFWAVESLGENNQRLVKLSAAGHRLLELKSVNYLDDVQINPYDKSILTVSRLEDRISLLDSTGTLISTQAGIYDPIKVRIR